MGGSQSSDYREVPATTWYRIQLQRLERQLRQVQPYLHNSTSSKHTTESVEECDDSDTKV